MAGRLIQAADSRIARLAHRLGGLVRWRRSWALLAGSLLGLLTGAALLNSLGGHLAAMHLPGVEAANLDQRAGPAGLDQVVSTWREWFAANADAGFRSPRTLALTWLAIDTFVLLPGYTLGALLVLLREHERTPPRRPALLPTLRWSAALVLALTTLDVIENAVTWFLVDGYWEGSRTGPGVLDTLLGAIASLKWAAALGVVVPVLVVVAVSLRSTKTATRDGLRVLRAHLLIAAVGIGAFLAPVQLPDLIVRWTAAHAAVTVTVLAIAALALWATGGLVLELHEHDYGADSKLRAGRWWRLAAIAVATALARIATLNLVTDGDPIAPLLPLAAAAALFAAGVPLRAGGATPSRVSDGSVSDVARRVPRWLAAGLVVITGIAALQAWTALFVQRDDPWLVFAVALGLIGGGFALFAGLRSLDERIRGRGYLYWSLGTTAATAAVVAPLVAAPTTAPITVGGVGVALAFVAAATITLAALMALAGGWAATRGLPLAFGVLGIRRGLPVLSLLVVWGLVAASLDHASHWNVRTLRAGGTPGVDVGDAFDEWVTTAVERTPQAGGGAGRVPIPLVMVASSGGGIRSAYWTALALDCLFLGVAPAEAGTGQTSCAGSPAQAPPQTAEPADVFLATGISGGSLGLVEWDARLATGGDADWVEDRLGGDFLAPSLARGLLVEVPRSWLHFDAAGRAEVIEQAWERGWGDPGSGNPLSEPFLASQTERGDRPLLVVNGASVFDGCALNVSILQAGATGDQSRPPAADVPAGDCVAVERYLNHDGADGPGPLPATVDVGDYLSCDRHRDIRRSTAALLSARFPYVSPAGRLAACGRGAATKFVVDGGYVDTSAAESAIALWRAIEPRVDAFNRESPDACVVPYFVQLDNSYLSTTSPPDKENPPNQLVAPAIALWQTTGLASRAERARAYAAHLFTEPASSVADPGRAADRYALLAPRNHPGAKAPLGWTLADASRRDLERELYRGNRATIEKVRGWLEDPPPCSDLRQ